MSPGRILFVDNEPSFLNTRAEFLQRNYEVLLATSLEQAEQILQEERIHLAILDIRMVNDKDEQDISGMLFAKTTKLRWIPAIMLTGHPTVAYVRDMLRPEVDQLPPAVDFLAKEEGPAALVKAVDLAFANHVRINWALVIRWPKDLSALQLVKLIRPDIAVDILAENAADLEDLFRKLFYDCTKISLGQVFAQEKQHCCIEIFAFDATDCEQQYFVVCGERKQADTETHPDGAAFTEIASARPMTRWKSAGVTWYSAVAYTLTPSSSILPVQAQESIWLDEINQETWVTGRRIELTAQDFAILLYLFKHVDQLCTRRAIVEEGLGEVYKSEVFERSRINSAMSRLRKKIESDPEQPRYLHTVRGRGYKLVVKKL